MIAYKSFDEETFSPIRNLHENGIQFMQRRIKRLIPKAVASGKSFFKASVLYSDDDGLTWQESKNRVFTMRGAMEPTRSKPGR